MKDYFVPTVSFHKWNFHKFNALLGFVSVDQLEELAFYLVELCLVEYEALKWKPSMLAASAIYTAQHILQRMPAWTRLLQKHAHYRESELK